MAGERSLTDDHLRNSLAMLDCVATAFDRYGVRYWLDAGTLLGVVREQRLLPWDTDIDLATTVDQLAPLQRAMADIADAGYRISERLHSHDNPPFLRGAPRIFKIRTRRLHFLRGDALIDVFVKYRLDEKFYWAIGGRKAARKTLSSPAHFYERLESVSFNGRQFAIPGNTDAYLTHRYNDWRTPIRKWNCFVDDNALIEPSSA